MSEVKLDRALSVLQKDVMRRAAALAGDPRPEARAVLQDSVQVMEKLGEAQAAAARNAARVKQLRTTG